MQFCNGSFLLKQTAVGGGPRNGERLELFQQTPDLVGVIGLLFGQLQKEGT